MLLEKRQKKRALFALLSCVTFYRHVLNAEVLPASVSSELSHVFNRRLVNNQHLQCIPNAPLLGHFCGLLS